MDAVSNVLKIANPNIQYQFVDYEEHALETDSDSLASATWSSPMRRATTTGGGCRQRHHHGLGLRLITAVNRENKVKQFIPTHETD